MSMSFSIKEFKVKRTSGLSSCAPNGGLSSVCLSMLYTHMRAFRRKPY
jgi:hypothetical protein